MYIPFGVIRQGEWQDFAQPPAVAARKPEIDNAYKQLILSVKLTCFLLLAGLLQLSARTVAQTRISLSLKGVTLEKAFAEIEKRSGYTVFYNVEVLRTAGAGLVTLVAKDATIEDVMQQCLKGLPLQFSIQDKTIFVKKEAARAVLLSPTGPANPIPETFSGVIKAESGSPLVGATIYIIKLKKSAVTDKEGQFSFKGIPDGEYEVEISYIGYQPKKVTVVVANHQAWLVSELAISMNKLDETVVKGYYNTTERLNTGDVTTVTGSTIQEQPVSDPILALEGRVPGLYIQQTSGVPGAYSQIHIMGQNSIANGNDPLYIVDGVPFSSVSLSNMNGGAVSNTSNTTYNANGAGISPFNSLSPADIESIVVLKDADATAIYGSRGANGVILITTRKGKAGSTRVDLNVYTGGGKVTRIMPMLNTSQYLKMRREAFQNDGLTMPSIITKPTDNNYDIDGVWDTTRYTNWQKVLIGNTATFTNAQGSVSGGNSNSQFLLSGGYSQQGTPYIGNYSDQKANFYANLNHSSSNQHFHFQLGVNYVYGNSLLPTADFTGSSITLAPDAPSLYDRNGNLNWQILNGTATFVNPAASTLRYCKAATNNLIGSLNLSYEILPGLKLLSSFGYNHDEMPQTYYGPASADAPPNNTNSTLRSVELGTTIHENWEIEPQLNYQLTTVLGRFEALMGTTFEQNLMNYSAIGAYGFTSDALITDPLAASNTYLLGYYNIKYNYNALFGRLGYNWNEKYLVNLTARRDGSSRFGPGKQFGNFGAAGIGWVFSKENLIEKNLSFLSYGKLRASYGITGNDQILDYQYLSSYSPISSTYEGITGLSPARLANPYFAWEVIKKSEAGLDLGFLKDRILISVVYYRNRTGNQLVGYSLPYITGFNSVQFNLPAVVQNTGIELTLSTINIKSKNFSWNTSVNLTVPSNKLVAFPNIQNFSVYAHTYVVGKSLYIKKLYHSTGVNPQTGLYYFGTKNANGLPSYPNDQVATKPITQKYYGGFDNKFSYKRFFLEIFVQFVDQSGIKWYSNSQPGVANQNEPITILGRWQASGNLTGTQRFGTNAKTSLPYSYYTLSDGIITNTSFIRVKNVALSYQLPVSLEGKSDALNARVYLQCQNLFTITSYLGMDPETAASSLPPLRMITAGLQVNF